MPLASTLAHLYHCRSAAWYKACWDLDHIGILALWLARALCEGYVLLFCESTLYLPWAILCLLVFPVVAYLVHTRQSTALFLPLYAFIHLPILAAAALNPSILGLGVEVVDTTAGLVGPDLATELARGVRLTLLGSLCGVVGHVIRAARVPERFYPGRFDIWGHSHQW